ncbi:MAG: RsmE family RNA methyltransferase [Ferruginibacter sp.]
MSLPFFYKATIDPAADEVVLDEETSKHIVQVLRMQSGEPLQLTDGNGNLLFAEIIEPNRKNCILKIQSSSFQSRTAQKTTLAVSLVKNAHRFEWLLEKATEIGVNEIIPLLCSRTEKQHFRVERMRSILVSAMLQSQQSWLPVLREPIKYATYIKSVKEDSRLKKFIAHCEKDEPRIQLYSFRPFDSSVILIGPEGDFTIDEIELALKNNFVPVALGNTRLRSETAGIVAAAILSFSQ